MSLYKIGQAVRVTNLDHSGGREEAIGQIFNIVHIVNRRLVSHIIYEICGAPEQIGNYYYVIDSEIELVGIDYSPLERRVKDYCDKELRRV